MSIVFFLERDDLQYKKQKNKTKQETVLTTPNYINKNYESLCVVEE